MHSLAANGALRAYEPAANAAERDKVDDCRGPVIATASLILARVADDDRIAVGPDGPFVARGVDDLVCHISVGKRNTGVISPHNLSVALPRAQL